jgi:hypothetical protein
LSEKPFSVDINPRDVDEAVSLFKFVGGNTDQAFSVAINRTATKTRSGTKLKSGQSASARIRSQVRLSASYVNKRLTIKKASRKELRGELRALYRGVLLSRYSTNAIIRNDGIKKSTLQVPKPPPRGIRVKVKPKGSTEALSNDFFYMRLKGSGVIAIARRTGTGKGRGYEVPYGPSVGQAFRGLPSQGVRDQVAPSAADQFEFELLDAMRFILAKKFPKE